jgi:hypothetical protein
MAKKKTKTLAQLKKQLQPIFNKFIRLRDSDNTFFTCISCSQTLPLNKMNAGHYYAVGGYDALRFNENNVHGECVGCNCFNESHLIGYGINIEVKIGNEKVEELHELAKDYKKNGFKWQRAELLDMIALYKQKVKDLE